ncbi:MAG: ATP-binding cassette domain-containing protein [Fibromonadales bacterium]|nr:ATP-binding cassette domain-containing protein [Fibromonadales bacterium]MCL1966248.1 ATP-binding cassette domain-containing protein [Fibromonadales bacterium]
MESISIKRLSFSHTVLASSELPKIPNKSISNILNKTFSTTGFTKAILLPKPLEILKNVSLSLEKGDILCISGKSGEGKSTLLRVIAGLEKASSGEITLFDEHIKPSEWTALSMAQRGLGFVFQNNALLSDLTVRDNIAVPLRYNKMMGTEDEIEQRVDRALLLMLARSFANEYPYSLSLGMRKRVAIARAWAMDAKILLLDEPTAGLDKNSRNNLLSLIKNLRGLYKTTILMVVSDLLVARDLDSKISFLIDKKLSDPMYYNEIRNNEDSRIRAMVM